MWSWFSKHEDGYLLRLTVKRKYILPSPPWRGSPLLVASSVCLPGEAARFCRSCWGRSYLSSWLASSVRSRNRGEHIRMSFVIKAGNRPLNLSWRMHTVTVTMCVCVCVWHFGGASPKSQPAPLLTRDKSDDEMAYGTPSFKSGSFGKCVHSDAGVKYVMLEQLAQFCFFLFCFCPPTPFSPLHTSRLLSSS